MSPTVLRLGRVAVLGFALAVAGLVALVVAGRSLRAASSLAFSVAALAFGFGLTAWAGTLLLGDTLEAVHDRLDAGGDWTAADSRQGMAVLAALGGGGMAGAVVATTALGLAVG